MATRGGCLVGDHSVRPRRPVRYVASKQTKSTKRKKKKPEWDSTVNDLNVHKATKEEQIKRHELHKSKNAGKVHLLSQVKNSSPDSTLQTPDTVERRKLAIVQEVLYGQDKDVLSESDKAMSVVKDLFGDDPKKFMGFPNITAAPSNALNGKENRFLAPPVAEMPETPTHLSLLSDSVMRTPALNELPDDHNQDELSPGTPPSGHERKTASSFQPMLDLQRFQQYMAEEQNKYLESCTLDSNGHGSDNVPLHDSTAAGQPTIPTTDGRKIIEERSGLIPGGRGSDHVAQHGSFPMVTDHASQPPSFLSQESAHTVIAGGPNFVKPVSMGESTTNNSIPSNARLQSRTASPDQQPRPSKTNTRAKTAHNPQPNSSSSGLRSLDDLKRMVEELETEVAAYEFETGRQQTKLTSSSVGSFSGYTASLITTVTKLMGYLKESEIQRKAEMVMREQVLQGFQEQRALVDALTNDILHTQEQNLALQFELLNYKKTTDEQLQYLKRELFAVLRSHEYQALSSSINTLYSLNPVALKQGGLDALHPSQHENQSFEYLPGAPVSDANEQEVTKRTGTGRDLTADSRNKPSFIPLATSQDHITSQYPALSRMAASPVSHKHNPPVTSSGSVQPHIQLSMEENAKQQQSVVPTALQVLQLPHNGHVPLGYPYSGSTTVDYGMPGHGQISSNIVMYPPSQVHFTQSNNREATTTQPQTTAPGVPSIHGPLIQNQPAPPGTQVVHTGSSSASPLYSSHQRMPGQLSINAQVQVQTAQPAVSQQPAVFNTMQPMPGVPQGLNPQESPKPPQAAFHRLSHEMPPAGPEEESRLTSPRHFENPESTGQGAAAVVTSAEVSDSKHNQAQPPRQVYVQTAPKMDHVSKSRVSRGMIGGLPANHQLRERLQNLANRQKTLTGKTGSQVVDSAHQNKGESKEVQPPRPKSPHVHFQDPPVSMNGLGNSKQQQQQQSPPVSPIPYKNPAVLRSNAPPDKRVVVNLPNAWSDVSSTISL